jgi:hypothetical protein
MEQDRKKTYLLFFKKFVIHIFRNIEISYNTLCLSLYYLFEIKRKMENFIYRNNKYLSCGRRMFITTLIISDKYLKDKPYKNILWAKITN